MMESVLKDRGESYYRYCCLPKSKKFVFSINIKA